MPLMTTTRTLVVGAVLVSLGLAAWHSATRPKASESSPTKSAHRANVRTPQAPPRAALPDIEPGIAARWKLGPTQNEQPDIDPEQLADEDERDAMLAEDRLPEQAAWRSAWLSEPEDEAWTRAVSEEMQRDVGKLAKGRVDVRDVSCRETVCRLYLDLSNIEDAEAFMAVERDPNLHYEFQTMNPGAEDTHHIEVLVVREDAFEKA